MRSASLTNSSLRVRTPGLISLARHLKALIFRLGFAAKKPDMGSSRLALGFRKLMRDIEGYTCGCWKCQEGRLPMKNAAPVRDPASDLTAGLTNAPLSLLLCATKGRVNSDSPISAKQGDGLTRAGKVGAIWTPPR
jgi:hypothetical protein